MTGNGIVIEMEGNNLQLNKEAILKFLACRRDMESIRCAAAQMTAEELERELKLQRAIVGASDDFRNHESDVLLTLSAEFDSRAIGKE